ncbi:carboxynorspermidine decarboxylase [Oscillatoria sp. FACHB-1407]|uniref:carboxynorspermidine decarboxylase n=1 Tax=Oscillatoria sp. FACHB-1407 TaxID=2692847 RepID=UPI001685AB3E|nr:carboxynorspermidine decarboxylase [Oscillatoria sp. FACHB-1407]MBD2459784.1 carboxynorspermidine decarboxylase [Oscillatoria sp. FACHB-1407]
MINYSDIPSPCYVLEEQKLIQNLEKIAAVQQQAGITVLLALKGFAMFSAFPIVKRYLSGAAASSLYEAMLIREKLGGSLHLYLPAYRPDEFDQLIQGASHITFNSLTQWEHYREKTRSAGLSPGLRINPEFSPVIHDIYNPASPYSRLGVRAENLSGKLPEGIEGLHCHNLCESDAADLETTLEQIEKLFGHHLPQIRWLNLGGGHLMTRQGYDIEHFIRVMTQFKARYPHLEIYIEPSSAIAWETGFLRATVLDLVETPGPAIAMLDVSFTAHMPDCLEMPYKPRIQGARQPQDGEPTYRMGGATCLAGDVMGMGDYAFDKPLQIGDAIVFEDMIHYTMVKTSMFNGVQHPSIGIIRRDGTFELIRQFNYDDYKRRLS